MHPQAEVFMNMIKKRHRFYLILLTGFIGMSCALKSRIEATLDHSAENALDRDVDRQISREVCFFPIAAETGQDDASSFVFADTWLDERTYGGERSHEGCDIIPAEDIRGVYPVVSMTDGVIENIGWLELGGYRIGVRSSGGMYYYYAHLESFAEDLEEGLEVQAGQFLGFVGDSGYGEEGTVGQFAVHLHIGIYVPNEDGEDEAVNPYPYLEQVKEAQIQAEYTVISEK